jgi:methionyl-tRNA formyltransferase
MSRKAKVVFLGSGPFALPALGTLACHSDAHSLECVVTRPDRPAHRGKKLNPTPVRRRAEELGLACRSPESASDPAFLAELRRFAADLFIVADYGEILSRELLALPAIGVFNLHASLLPKHRGAAPVAHALLAGDTETGVTLFRVERKLDSGPIVASERLAIRPDENAGELEERLAALAGELIARELPRLASGRFTETPQDPTQATYAPRLSKSDGLIHWDRPPRQLCDFVRAMTPWPSAFAFLERPHGRLERTVFLRVVTVGGGERGADPVAAPGRVVEVSKDAFCVACRGGSVRVVEVKREGRHAMDAAAYLRGHPLAPGARFLGAGEEIRT